MLVPCTICDNGTGSDGNPCTICDGDGEIDLLDAAFPKINTRMKLRGVIWDAMITRLDTVVYDINVFKSYQVLECLDATEHNALTDSQKEGVNILLMCGRVDLNDGKAGKVRLWNWFGAESTTVANLTALLT